MDALKRTPLHDLHLALGARMVPFAGHELPVQYQLGVMQEHLHTRSAAGLFDVSHMGQVILRGPDAALALERLVPADVAGLAQGRQRYGLLMAEDGGILDDLMITNRGEDLLLVVNAAMKEQDISHLQAGLPELEIVPATDRALLAVQGPAAEAVLEAVLPGSASMKFMDHRAFGDIWVSRSGYTGEDGFELSVSRAEVADLAKAILDQPQVEPIGLGARDSLRLEAGMCLYGNDITPDTSPVEAALEWSLGKARRPGGSRAGGYPGASVVERQLAEGAPRRRVGLSPEGRAPMRAGTTLYAAETGGDAVGRITSGGYGPSVEAPVSMGYVEAGLAAEGTPLWGDVRGRRLPVRVAPMPFIQTRYKR